MKAIFKKSLALLISVMLVLTAFGGALAVFADDAVVEEEAAFDYGTYDDGFNTRADSGANDGNPTIGQVPALDNLANLNWAEGLKYWTSKGDRYGLASEYVTVFTDSVAGNYIGFNIDNNMYDGISTPYFSLDVEEGTTIYAFADYMIHEGITSTGKIAFNTQYPMGITIYDGDDAKIVSASDNVAHDDVYKNGHWSSRAVGTFTASSSTLYRVEIQDTIASDKEAVLDDQGNVVTEAVTLRAGLAEQTGGEPAVFVRNLRFCTLNDDGTYTDIATGKKVYKNGVEIGGTEEEGIVVSMFNGAWMDMYNTGTVSYQGKNSNYFIPQEGFQNGDFSQGFKYWTLRYNASNTSRNVNSVDDIHELVDGAAHYKGSASNFMGIGSAYFTLSNVKAGDVLIATADLLKNDSYTFRFQLGELGVGQGKYDSTTKYSTWTNISTSQLTVSSDNAVFGIMVETHAGANASYSIDNIRILKVNADGTFTNVMTGETTYANGDPVQPLGGTEAEGIIINGDNYVSDKNSDGMDTTNYAFGVADKFTNYNFSEGFKYYSTGYNSALDIDSISDFWAITEDGTAKQTYNPYQYSHITSMPFYLSDVKAGDTIKIGVTLKKNTNVEVRLFENKARVAAFSNGTTYNDWISLTSSDVTVSADDSFFWFTLRNNTATSDVNIEVKEFFILKKLANGTYINLFTGENVYIDNRLVGGTYEDGWYSAANTETSIYAGTYDTFNGDFSQGLKYWAWQANTVNKSASDAATVMVEDGNEYVTIKNNQAAWAGIRTFGFKLDNVKAGDKLTVMFKYRNGDLSKHRFFLGVANADDTNDTTWSIKSANDSCATAMLVSYGNDWGIAVNKNYITVGTAKTTKTPASYIAMTDDVNDHIWFYVEIENNAANVGIDIDDIQIVKYIDATTVETLDGETISFADAWVGTFSGGATVSGNNANSKYYSEYGVQNGDFSEGFKYWCAYGINNATAQINTHMNLIQEDSGNNYVRFNGETFTYYSGFMTAKMKIPASSLAVDDKVAMILDVYDPDNNCNTIQAVVWANNCGAANKRMSQCNLNNVTVLEDKGNGWKTILTSYNSTLTSTPEGDWEFSLWFEVPTGKTSTAGIDNIRLVKQLGSYSALDLTTNETIEWDPSWAGTFNGGATVSGGNLNSQYTTKYGFINGDFSQGLKYWGATGGATSVTEYADLVKDGDNYYIQLDGEARTGYSGFRTGRMSIEANKVAVGDYVTVMFDLYDPDNTASSFQVVVEASGNNGRLSNTNGKNLKAIANKGNGWKTVVGTFSKATVEACNVSTVNAGDWAFIVMVEVISSTQNAETGEWTTVNKSTAAFDNFQLVKKVDDTTIQTMDGEIISLVCDHVYESVVTEPTCTDKGYTTHTCTLCGESTVDTYVDALGHSYDSVVTEPTCDTDGYTTHTCTVCGDTYTDSVVPAGHKYDAVVTEPTCDAQGFTTYTCSVCGDTYVDNYVDALGHSYGDWEVVTDATCTEAGSKQKVCGTCGDVVTEEIPATGHAYDAVVTEPTCTEQGYTTHTCANCGDSYVDSYVDALGHSYGDWEVVTDATCTEAGSKQKVCSVCGDIVSEEIPATGHAYDAVVTEPTCTEQGYTTYTCANCGDSYVDNYVDALGHSYESVVTEPTCDTEGYTTHTCTVCGDSYVDSTVAALGHNYESVVTEPTCTEDGYTTHTCTVCGDSYVDSYVDGGHKYGDWEVVTAAKPGVAGSKQKVCSVCGDVVTEEIPALSEISFYSASLVLQSNLAFNFKVDSALFADGAYANPYVVFNFNGVETIVDAYTVDGDKYVFTLMGITPDKMKDTVTATLYATFEGVEYTAVKEYSVAEYCYSMLDQYADNVSLRTLVVDLLNYGAASQVYSGYNADALVNADLTSEQAAWASADVTINNALNTKYETVDNATATWKGAGLTLLESVAMRLQFRTDSIDGISVKVTSASGEWILSGEDIIKSGDFYYVVFDKLGANKMSEEVFMTVMKDGVAVSNTAKYSIESYAYAKQNSEVEGLADLVKAMMRYGNSAKNYN